MLIKRIALLVMIFILSLPASALATEAGSGIIGGQVINGTEDSSSVANQEVTLKTCLNNNDVDSATTTTDAEGHFAFDGLPTDPDHTYQITLKLQETDYTSDRLSFDNGETTKFTEVIVYDATNNDEVIKVVMAHTIIYVEQGSLKVVEYSLFVNEADRTYVGSKEVAGGGAKETLAFPLPEKTTELQFATGLMECCIQGSELRGRHSWSN